MTDGDLRQDMLREPQLQFRGDDLHVTSALSAGPTVFGAFEFGLSGESLRGQINTLIFDHLWQGLVLIAAGMALSFLIARYASQLIRDLANTAGQIGRGDLDVTVPIQGPKEVATLGDALEHMRLELRELYPDLEQRVKSRTEELSRAYETLRTEMAERERAEAERRMLEVQALAQSKLATLGQLATGVVHEVNQPLAYISMMVQGLREDFELKDVDEEAVVRRLDTAIAQVERIDKIVRHLRTFGRSDSIEKAPVNLETVLDDTMLLLGERLRLREPLNNPSYAGLN